MATARDMTHYKCVFTAFSKLRSDIGSYKPIFPGAGIHPWFKVRKTRRADLQEDFTLADSSEEAPSHTRMLGFMAKAKLEEDFWPCSYSSHPNHKVGTQV